MLPRFRETLALALSRAEPGTTVLIAEADDSSPVGFIHLRAVADIGGLPRGHVADLAVTETARRSGIGTALMEAGERWARERGFALLSLEVWSTNDAALAFYRDLGYAIDSLTLIKPLG